MHDEWLQAQRQKWREQREASAYLALQNGVVLRGHSIGAPRETLGELVFHTGMTGYQEILSDPSYAGQLVLLTCPEIGNVGMNLADMESERLHANGLLVRACNEPSNWRAEQSLSAMLREGDVPALAGIDTRALTLLLRGRGTQRAFLSATGATPPETAVRMAREWEGLDGQDYARRVSCRAEHDWDVEGRRSCSWGLGATLPAATRHVVVYDFGLKWNIARCLRQQGLRVTVVPAATPAARVLEMAPDGILLSNGPADPRALDYAVDNVRQLLGKAPLLGICLGHQLLALALDASIERLKFGHHGGNHPVKDLVGGQVAITSQNHNYAVVPESIDPARVRVTHRNLNDGTVEGLEMLGAPAFAIQYHPEAAPGPHDAAPVFSRFREMIAAAPKGEHVL